MKITPSVNSLSNSASDLKLIHIIKEYPTLYDPKHRSCQSEKDDAWVAVADVLGIQVVDAKNRWRNVRDRYVREKKRMVNDGEQVYRLKDPWPLLDDMSFLWGFITHRSVDKFGTKQASSKKKRKKPNHPLLGIQPRPIVDIDEDPPTSGRAILPRPSPEWVSLTLDYDEAGSSPGIDPNVIIDEEEEGPQKIFKQEPDDYEEHGSQLRRLLEDRMSQSEELQPLIDDSQESVIDVTTRDEDELYCLSVAAALKRFTPIMKARAKCKIQQVLFDVEFNPS